MSRSVPVHAALFLGSLSLAALPSRAVAEQCSTDADCAHGFSCEVTAVSGCAGVACPDGADCPPPEPCVSEEYSECLPSRDCSVDSDCATGMVCYEHTQTSCTDSVDLPGAPSGTPTCPPGVACLVAPTPPGGCTEQTVTACTPRWALPCRVDSDCGTGFECAEIVEEWCNGGGSEPDMAEPPPPDPDSADGEDPVPPESGRLAPPEALLPPDGQCGATPTGRYRCEPQKMECEANTDCPEDWLCKVTGATSGGSAPCWQEVDADGTLGDVVCAPVEPQPTEVHKQCVPPYWDYGYDVSNDDVGPVRGGSGGGTTGAPEPAPQDPETGPTAGGTPPATPNPPTQNQGPDGDEGESGSAADPSTSGGSESSDDGCQMSHGPGSSGVALLLGALGWLGVSRRRRRTV